MVGSVQTGDGSRDKPAPESQSADKDEEAAVGRECGNVYGHRNTVSVLDVWRLRSQDTPGEILSLYLVFHLINAVYVGSQGNRSKGTFHKKLLYPKNYVHIG